MMEFGKSLRAAREAKGLTVAQLAEQTRMAPTLVEDLENENFAHIAAPIYGRGFVKLYCEAVGLDPKPLVAEFMEILNGNREPRIKERPAAAPVESAAPAAPEPPPADELPEPIPTPPPQQDLFRSSPPAAAPADDRTVSKYASTFRLPEDHPISSYWRIGALALIALALLALLLFGLRALHRTMSAFPADGEDVAEAQVEIPAAADTPTPARAEAPAVPRKQQEIPQLYID